MDVSAVLERRRVDRGITMAELARRTSVSYDMLTRTLKGSSMVKGDQLIRICRELRLEISDFPD